MLWVNLIMDTFAALALATEPPKDSVLLRMPYHKDAPIVTSVMWRNVIGHGVYQIIILLAAIFAVGRDNFLVFNYQDQCLQIQGEQCLVYNPFFTHETYYTARGLAWWDDVALKGQFDKDLLAEMQARGLVPEVGAGTQKLLHYTLVF
mmetsp:Transcript_27324/g.41548  ORF Transcript_27324/g.41548 Transcript_27324/m.41548 type:complete len:148 (+) Transcript_27324:960-1403(+)